MNVLAWLCASSDLMLDNIVYKILKSTYSNLIGQITTLKSLHTSVNSVQAFSWHQTPHGYPLLIAVWNHLIQDQLIVLSHKFNMRKKGTVQQDFDIVQIK